MALDLEEQDQLDALKTWWKVYGNMISSALLIVAVVFAAYRGWEYYQYQQSAQASARYQALTQLDPKDAKAIKSLAGEIMDKYTSTPYAGRAAVGAAKANLALKDSKTAKLQLQWAADKAKEDAVKAIALLQLAAIQLDEKDYAGALQTLVKSHDAGFDGLFADLKGDVLVAQGKSAEAKLAYQEALGSLDAQGRYQHYTRIKLEALGS